MRSSEMYLCLLILEIQERKKECYKYHFSNNIINNDNNNVIMQFIMYNMM